MLNRALAITTLLAAAACTPSDPIGGEPDATTDDAAPPTDASWPIWYADRDGDGYGDPTAAVSAPAPPPDHVYTAGDCDDSPPEGARSHPGAADVCDGVDNDCVPATPDVCLAGCRPITRPDGNHYLVCSGASPWSVASLVCSSNGYQLVRVDDEDENAWVWTEAAAAGLTVPLHLGGKRDRSLEFAWRWEIGGDAFWNQGPLIDAFQVWAPGEPAYHSEDCLQMVEDGGEGGVWRPGNCDLSLPFVCERPAVGPIMKHGHDAHPRPAAQPAADPSVGPSARRAVVPHRTRAHG
jgi:hypothetical protein